MGGKRLGKDARSTRESRSPGPGIPSESRNIHFITHVTDPLPVDEQKNDFLSASRMSKVQCRNPESKVYTPELEVFN